MLEVRNLAFSYCRRPVLRDVSFSVERGETVVVTGANGAGKTTLLKVLSTLAVPDSGSVAVDGFDAFSRPLKYRRQLGCLFETAAIYGDMTPAEYLSYRARLKGEPAKRIRRRVGEAVEMCRLGGCLDVPVRRLSNGLRRRVAIADALLLRPRVLLLDDFLSGIDGPTRAACAEILSEAAQFSAVVATGHELPDLARLATRVLVLKSGTVTSTIETAGLDASAAAARIALEIEGKRRT
jgi:ABC-type multidrug transport system ATPase subunit